MDAGEVPDYYEVIKHPMDWSTMADKLERHEYETATDFQVRPVQLTYQ